MKKKKKKPASKAKPKKSTKIKKKKAVKRPAPKKSKKSKASAAKSKGGAPKIEGQWTGKITHYFPHVNAAAMKIQKGTIRKGDSLRIKGHTSDLILTVLSLQIDHQPIEQGKKGDEIGLQVPDRVREGDDVYKL